MAEPYVPDIYHKNNYTPIKPLCKMWNTRPQPWPWLCIELFNNNLQSIKSGWRRL